LQGASVTARLLARCGGAPFPLPGCLIPRRRSFGSDGFSWGRSSDLPALFPIRLPGALSAPVAFALFTARRAYEKGLDGNAGLQQRDCPGFSPGSLL